MITQKTIKVKSKFIRRASKMISLVPTNLPPQEKAEIKTKVNVFLTDTIQEPLVNTGKIEKQRIFQQQKSIELI